MIINSLLKVGLLNSIPNAILFGKGKGVMVTPCDTLSPLPVLAADITSFIGHESYIPVVERKLKVKRLTVNRNRFTWENFDEAWAVLVVPPRRLDEGEMWTEQEILNMEVQVFRILLL
jgi:hypothetical protein